MFDTSIRILMNINDINKTHTTYKTNRFLSGSRGGHQNIETAIGQNEYHESH